MADHAADDSTDKTTSAEAGNTATHGDHDRVQMLSLRADGTPDQTRPELIGDPDVVREQARRQFTEQAVSAADVAARTEQAQPAEDLEPDPTVAALTEKHEQARDDAQAAADQAVSDLVDASPASSKPDDSAATSTNTGSGSGKASSS